MATNVSRKTRKSPEFWTSSEFGDILNVSPNTLKKLLKEGQINGAVQIGKHWRIHKETFYKQFKEDFKND